MKMIGLLGGMSWESSIEYERMINRGVREALGGTHSADLIIRSYDFTQIEELQAAGEWDAAGALLARDARRLQDAGADFIVLCTNTMHMVAPAIEAAITVPFLHLADATARAVLATGVETVALLGTRYTMEHDLYRGRLEAHGLTVRVPDGPDRAIIHDVIYEELVKGIINPDSKEAYVDIVDRLIDDGAQGVIAGCAEIELLIGPDDVTDVDGAPLPYFPTTRIHAEAAVALALEGARGEVVEPDR